MPKTAHEVWAKALQADANRPQLNTKDLLAKIAAAETKIRKDLIAEQKRRNALTPEQRVVEDVTKALEDPPPDVVRVKPRTGDMVDAFKYAAYQGFAVARPETFGVIRGDTCW